MTIMWTVDGDLPTGDDRAVRVYATETDAYAALGRLVASSGYYSGDWGVTAREVVGQPEPADEPAPFWPLGEKYPRPWHVSGDGDGVLIRAADGHAVVCACVARLGADEDRALAEYLVALVNADGDGRG